MTLVERGQLGLDDPVCRHLPASRLAAPGVAKEVTVRHLLTHTGGFVGDWFLDRVVALEPPEQAGLLGEFGRDVGGRVAWLRWGGRMAPRLADGEQE
jgi:CubicO group peptidase (beta-lactamase class C family)